MKVNFIVENSGPLQYLGCNTAARNLYEDLSDKTDIEWNSDSLDFDIAHFHTFGPKSLLYAKRFPGKSVMTVHSTPRLNKGNISLWPAFNLLYRPIYERFDHLISVSERLKEELREDLGIEKDITTIYNGIDAENFSRDKEKGRRFRDKMKVGEDELLVLTVGQRTPRKGIFTFLELAKRFPQIKFVWVGGFPYNLFSKDYFDVKRSIDQSSENAIFPGFIEDIEEAYSAADAFFMPSYSEGHSIVMLEALSMGLPLIARDLKEFREAFDDSLLYFDDINDIDESYFEEETLEKYRDKTSIISNYDIERSSREHIQLYREISQ